MSRRSMRDRHAPAFLAVRPGEYGWIDDSMAGAAARLPAGRRCSARWPAPASTQSIAVQARQTLDETRWLLDARRRAPVHRRRRRLGRSAGAGRRRAARRSSRAHPRLVGVRHIVQAEPDGFLAAAGVPPRHRAARAPRPDLRHPGLRAAAAGGGRVRRAAFRGSASCSITSASRTSSGDGFARWRRAFRGAGGVSQRMLQAVGAGHRGGLAVVDAGAAAAVPRRGARVLRPGAADDRLGLAGLHGRGAVRADDGRRARRRLGGLLGGRTRERCSAARRRRLLESEKPRSRP